MCERNPYPFTLTGEQSNSNLTCTLIWQVDIDVIGTKFNSGGNGVDNRKLIAVNEEIRSHPVEVVGKQLRGYMTAMEKISVGGD